MDLSPSFQSFRTIISKSFRTTLGDGGRRRAAKKSTSFVLLDTENRS
jgi:hypothetical protein